MRQHPCRRIYFSLSLACTRSREGVAGSMAGRWAFSTVPLGFSPLLVRSTVRDCCAAGT